MLSLALWEGTSGKSDTSHVSQQNGPGSICGKEPLANQTRLMLVSKMASAVWKGTADKSDMSYVSQQKAVWEGTTDKSDTPHVSQQNGPGCMGRDR